MSGQSTTWFRQKRLRQTFFGEALGFTEFQVALTRRVPASNATFSPQLDEPGLGVYGYQRASISLNSTSWRQPSATEMGNAVAINFPRASGLGWGTLHGWALIARGLDRVCAVGTLVEPLRCIGGIQPYIGVNGIVFGDHD